jgi:DNA-binding NarL/FixJ family response regulator
MPKIKIILIDDHNIVRNGIKSLLSNISDIEIIAEVSNSEELFSFLKNQIPDIIITDISMPDMSGIEITRYISENFPVIKVLILSMYINEDYIFNSINAGAKGYLPKNTTGEELIEAIRTINSGKEFYNKTVSDIMLKHYINKAKNAEEKEEQLSKREYEILKLHAEGQNNKEIADILFISIRTVESHKNHIMQKLKLKNPVDMVKYAIKNKIIEL